MNLIASPKSGWWLAVAYLVIAAVLWPGVASACTWPEVRMSAAQIRKRAQERVHAANVIADAEVIKPMRFGPDWKPGLTPIAHLRIIKIWKGTVEDREVPIVYITSCDIGLERKGEKVRILLTGTGVFRAEQFMNGGGVPNIAPFNTEVDRFIGHPRPRGFARFPGEELPPPKPKNVR